MSVITALLVSVLGAWAGPVAGDVTVKVVDEQQRPVSGAWVASFFASGTGFRTSEYGEQGIDAIQPWIERGASGPPSEYPEWTASDADGRASARVETFWNDLVAVTPTLSGHAIFVRGTAAKGDVVEIVVKPHRFWRVPVVDGVDSKLKPVVDVEFGTEDNLRRLDSFHRITSRTTKDGDNVATLGPIDLLFDPLEIDPTIVARLDLPFDPAPRLRWRASQIGEPVAPLAIPPHGSLEIHVVDREGRIVTRPGFVTVKRDSLARGLLDWMNSRFGEWRQLTRDGVARYDRVGLGAALVLEDEDGRSYRGCNDPVIPFDQAGWIVPLRTAGERRVLTCPSPDPARREVVVRGRAVDPHGTVLARRELSIELLDPTCARRMDLNPPRWTSRDIVMPADGSFTEIFILPGDASGRALLLVTDVGPLGRREPYAFAAKTLEIDAIENQNVVGLGDVALEPIPLLTTGRAVDEKGEPIARLDVSVRCDERALDRDPSVPAWWCRPRIRPGATTTRDGRFEVRGFGREQAWTLTAGNDEFSSGPGVPIAPPGTDFVVHCERGRNRITNAYVGQLAGSLLLDPDVPRSVVDVELRSIYSEADRGDGLNGLDLEVAGDRFGKEWISTGTYNVTLTFRDFGQPRTVLATIPDVKIERGTTTLLAPIDLRGRIKVKHLSLRDRAGAPILTGFVIAREDVDPDGNPRPDFTQFHEGESVACAVASWPKLDFMARGLRRVSRHFEDANPETIVLPPALLVHVRLPETLRLPPAPLTLDVDMRTDDVTRGTMLMGGSNPPDSASATFDATHTVDLQLPAATCYELKLYVSHCEQTTGSSSWHGANVQPPQNVTLFDRDEPRRVDLDVTQAEIDAAVKQLGF